MKSDVHQLFYIDITFSCNLRSQLYDMVPNDISKPYIDAWSDITYLPK